MHNHNVSIQCIIDQRKSTDFDWMFDLSLYILNGESIYFVDPHEPPMLNAIEHHSLIHSNVLVALDRYDFATNW